MGDRCYSTVVCLQKDVTFFKELGYMAEEDLYGLGNNTHSAEPPIYKMVDLEANYANGRELDELASKGIVFFGSHGSGDSYSSGVFASDGYACHWLDADIPFVNRKFPLGIRNIVNYQAALRVALDIFQRNASYVPQDGSAGIRNLVLDEMLHCVVGELLRFAGISSLHDRICFAKKMSDIIISGGFDENSCCRFVSFPSNSHGAIY